MEHCDEDGTLLAPPVGELEMRGPCTEQTIHQDMDMTDRLLEHGVCAYPPISTCCA